MSMTSSCSSRQSSPPGNALIRDFAWLRAPLRSLVCVTIGTQHDAPQAISGGRTACNNACLACGVNSPPELLSSSTATSFWRRISKEDIGRSFDITIAEQGDRRVGSLLSMKSKS